MKMSNRFAIAALAATAMMGGTMPAAALPAVSPEKTAAAGQDHDSANLQRSGRAKAGAARPAGGSRAAARPAGGQAQARPARQANKPHNVRTNAGTNFNGAANANRNRDVNRNVNRNVNRDIDRDINVDVDHHWDNDWDDHWHPIATGVAVGMTAAVIGSIVNSVPSTGCVTTIVNGISYYQCGSTWYQPTYAGTTVQYIVVNPPG